MHRNHVHGLALAVVSLAALAVVSLAAPAWSLAGPVPDRTPPTIQFASRQTPDLQTVMFDIELTDPSGIYDGEMRVVGGPTFWLMAGANHIEMQVGNSNGQLPVGFHTFYVLAVDGSPSHNARTTSSA